MLALAKSKAATTAPTRIPKRRAHHIFSRDAKGHTLLEAIIAVTLTSLISAGLWQLVAASSYLAKQASLSTQAQCDIPNCQDGGQTIRCSCGREQFVLLR